MALSCVRSGKLDSRRKIPSASPEAEPLWVRGRGSRQLLGSVWAVPGLLKAVCVAATRVGAALVARSAALGAVASAGRALYDGCRPLPAVIARSFERGQYHASALATDLHVQPVFGGGAQAAGRFLTPTAPSAEAARGALQLPAANAATHVANIIMPQRTTIYTGTVAGSTTGATRIFVSDPGVLRVVSTLPLR